LGDANCRFVDHDVGPALANALPEASAHEPPRWRVDLRKIPSAESELSPLELWCNEAQERYVLALVPGSVPLFAALCDRERCPYAVVARSPQTAPAGHRPAAGRHAGRHAHGCMVGKTPRHDPPCTIDLARRRRDSRRRGNDRRSLDRLLCLPTIADKSFLSTIGDRSVGGMISRDRWWDRGRCRYADVAVS